MARDTRAAYLREIARLAPEFARLFQQVIYDTRSTAKLEVIEEAIRSGDMQAAIRALQIPEQFFAPLDFQRVQAFQQGGAYALSRLPKKPYPGSVRALVVRFNGRNQRAENWIRAYSAQRITAIQENQRDAVRKAIEAGMSEGRPPRQIALDLVGRVRGDKREGGIIGLTSQQTDWVIARRAKLQDEGRPAAQVDRMVERYKSKLLRKRGETIARTETVAALNAGRYEALLQLVDNGDVRSASDISLTWSATMDARTRDLHVAMNDDTVTLGTPFLSPSGAMLRFPGDTQFGAKAEDLINCRCYMQPKINWLAQAE